jgi:predicted dehydrogenase
MKKLRVGITGTGNWADNAHIPAFKAMSDDAEVVALCNHHIEKAQEVGYRLGITSVYSELDDMIAKENLDILSIVTSRGEHFKPSCAAIDAGLDILCEKPIGHSLEEAQELVRRIKNTSIVHHVGFTFRYSPAVQYAHKLIREGFVGDIYHVQGFEQNGQLVDPETPLPRRGFSKKTDSGALHGYGSHLIDLTRLLCGEPEEVIGHEATFIKSRPVKEAPQERLEVGVDDSTIWLATYANGAHGVMQASKVAIGTAPGVELRIYGSKAALWIRLAESAVGFDRLWTADCNNMDFVEVNLDRPFAGDNWPIDYFTLLVRDFVRRVRERDLTPGHGDYYDGLRCQEIMSAIEASFVDGRWHSTHLS